jgi:hypothetical protein
MHHPPLTTLALAGFAALATLASPALAGPGNEDIHIQNGRLTRDNREVKVRAIMAPDLLTKKDVLADTAPVLAGIAYVGGTAVCADLPGYNADGTALDPEGVATIGLLGHRTKEQHMSLVVRVLGDHADPAFRANAVKTAAAALKNERRALYYFDGDDADQRATEFRALAPKLVVAAPTTGHVQVVTESPADAPTKPTLVVGTPNASLDPNTHFLMGPEKADYDAVELALTNEVQKAPWEPDNTRLSEAERAEGFIALANGQDFAGWWYPFEKNSFVVNADGDFEFKEKGGKAILTRNRYANFILRLDYKIAEGGNSGVFLRAPRAARQSKIGMEFQIHGDPGVPASDDMTGAIYLVVPPKVNASNPPMTWNSLEIILDGSHIKATLNGQVVHDFDMDTVEELKYRLKDGFIGLQDHDHFVAFRNVRLKEL